MIGGRAIVAAAALCSGCAFGDGLGFASVEGEITVVMAPGPLAASPAGAVTLDTVEVTVRHVQLEAETALQSGILERKVSALPVGGVFDALRPSLLRPTFGPYEVDRGQYGTIAVVLDVVDLLGTIGGQKFHYKVQLPEGIRIAAEAHLPVNRGEPPEIVFRLVSVALPTTLFQGVTPAMDHDAAAAAIAEDIARHGVVAADWDRFSD